MISAVFIDRPRLAFVVSIVITLAGLIAITAIPVAQFPDIVPPQVTLSAVYPGADAEVLETFDAFRFRGRSGSLCSPRVFGSLNTELPYNNFKRAGKSRRRGCQCRCPSAKSSQC